MDADVQNTSDMSVQSLFTYPTSTLPNAYCSISAATEEVFRPKISDAGDCTFRIEIVQVDMFHFSLLLAIQYNLL